MFLVAFLFNIGVFPTASKAVLQARSEAQATRLAEAEMEQVLSLDYVNMVDRLASTTGTATISGRTAPVTFQIQTTVTEPETDLKRVHVLVSWTTSGTTPHVVRLETFRAKL